MTSIYFAKGVGLQNFVFHDVPTYRRLTLEFLCSLQSTVKTWHGEDMNGVIVLVYQKTMLMLYAHLLPTCILPQIIIIVE